MTPPKLISGIFYADVGYPAIHFVGETARALAFNNVHDSLAPTALNTFRSRRPVRLLLMRWVGRRKRAAAVDSAAGGSGLRSRCLAAYLW